MKKNHPFKGIELLKEITVLYAEDEDDIRNNITEALAHYCKRSIGAKNGEEALVLYEKYAPDIVILDIHMPLKNGMEVAKSIRKNDTKTRLIIATAYTEKEYLLEAIEQGLTRYLTKPLSQSSILEALTKAAQEIYQQSGGILTLISGVTFNINKAVASRHGHLIKLTHNEIKFIELLIAKKGDVLSYEEIEEELYGGSTTPQAIRSLVNKIRLKIGQEALKMHSGIGYSLVLA